MNDLPSTDEYAGVSEVLKQVTKRLTRGHPAVSVPADDAYGRVAAADVSAPRDIPEAPKSHMDGYAVRAEDLEGAEEDHIVALDVVGDLGPGGGPMLTVASGQAVRVATGAPLPTGADTVVQVERVRVSRGQVLVGFAPDPGAFVYPRGADVRRGAKVIRRGHRLRAQDVGLLLTLGVERVKVYPKPRVAVLATGSELTDGVPRPGEVKNSHSPIFLRLLEELGCAPVDLGVAKDSASVVAGAVRRARERSDVVVTLGGTSMGRRDIVVEAVSSLRPELLFHGIRMDRGRVAGVAVVRGVPVLMMPGPPQGAMNAFLLLALPIISDLAGMTDRPMTVGSRLQRSWSGRARFSGFTKVVYVALSDGGKKAEPLLGETESVTLLAKADGFVVVPEGVLSLPKGSKVEVTLLRGFSFV